MGTLLLILQSALCSPLLVRYGDIEMTVSSKSSCSRSSSSSNSSSSSSSSSTCMSWCFELIKC